ncbi:hypothetical protein QMK17_05940 [Rhodococcus sp. G-MC3]|uniref:hypothetical protein n=1 Tax=Rhodococcus sp. G-MC3 TaxID=3046209 RepID=UPI0024B8F1CC|nr:hypothetical protein [Rhodococcus sp. G-MC3]MDJ0392869.1 hypothetical protein [Rhodococcus sp. G-MC3]
MTARLRIAILGSSSFPIAEPFAGGKGPHLAIDAARLAGIPLRLAGPPSNTAYFADEVVPRLGDGIRSVGHLRQKELATLVGTADENVCSETRMVDLYETMLGGEAA